MREIVKGLLARPDEIMLEIGAGGELLVARLRAVIAAMLLLLPLANALTGGSLSETLIGPAGAVFVNVFAQIWLALAHRKRRYRWLSYATAAYDVTACTLVLVLLGINHLPSSLNSMIVWCGYPLSIMVSALRNDGRVTLLAGGLAIVQYGILVLVVFHVVASPEQLISIEYGTVTASNQAQRMVLLAIFTLITAIVVYRMQRLVVMSGTDGLTGLSNRVWLLHRAPRLFDLASHEGSTITLALIDLDWFKRINDDIGHLQGNRALRHVVAIIQESMEPEEWLVRLGGAEFVLLLHKPIGNAWERVDRMRRNVAERPFTPDRSTDPQRITFSAGLACFPAEGSDLSMLLQRADRRVQQAKLAGRNRVVARDA